MKAFATVCSITKQKTATEKAPKGRIKMAEIILNSENFETQVGKAGVLLVDFYADWCGPCKMLAPLIEEAAREHPEISVGKINVDNEPQLAAAFGISSIPTLMVFKDGKAVKKSVGFISKEEIEELLK